MHSRILISGRLIEPADDKPRSGVTLTLSSVKNSSAVLKHATYQCVTGGNGEYSFNAAPGTYAVSVSVYGAEPERVGQIRVYSDSLPGDLNTFLMAPAEDDLTPEIIRLVDSMRSEAVKAAESAKQSEQVTSKLACDVATHAEQVASNTVVVEQKTTIATDAAATAVAAKEQASKDALATGKDRQVTQTKAQEAAASANAAKAAQDSIVEDATDVRDKALQVAENTTLVANNAVAVQLNTEQVAQNTQTVTTKTQQVSENAQAVAANTRAVTQMRDEVVAKTSMAQAAADTATQKAASAAEHDAAAAEYARRAQEAAQATAGALMDGGAADLSAGVYPQPVVVSGTSRPTFWKVTKGGSVGGVDYGVGDTLIYTIAGSGSYYKIDNTESVTSVQGEKGAVTLTPEKIGADAAGAAAELVDQHAQKVGAHPVSSIAGLTEALADKVSVQELYSAVVDKAAKEEVSNSIATHKAEERAHTPQNVGADPAGTAASAVSDHEDKLDPHPQYLTSAEIGDLEDRVAALERRKSTCLVHALGTGAPHETVVSQLPSAVVANSRYVLPNPFGNETPVIVWAEIFNMNKWANSGFVFAQGGYGTVASYVQGEGIVVQTGSIDIGSTSANTGGGHGTPVLPNFIGSAPCRVFVRKLEL